MIPAPAIPLQHHFRGRIRRIKIHPRVQILSGSRRQRRCRAVKVMLMQACRICRLMAECAGKRKWIGRLIQISLTQNFRETEKKWTMPIHDWAHSINKLAILLNGCLTNKISLTQLLRHSHQIFFHTHRVRVPLTYAYSSFI